MSHANRESSRKRTRKAAPVLGAAGLLALASSGSANASVDGVAARNEFNHHVLLGEEEVSDVSLATFRVLDTERGGPLTPGINSQEEAAAEVAVVVVAEAVEAVEAGEAAAVVARTAVAEDVGVASLSAGVAAAAVVAAQDAVSGGGASMA
jgi:hypothetical protein